MNKSDEDTAVVDVANVEWGVYKMQEEWPRQQYLPKPTNHQYPR